MCIRDSTYSGHPLGCAAALATLDIYEKEQLFTQAQLLEPLFEDAVHSLADCPHVIDIPNIGLMAALELEPVVGHPSKRAFDIYRRAFAQGLLIRTTGDTLALSPPLIIKPQEIEQIITTLKKLLKS